MDWTLEVIVVPVSDVERARDFYRDKVGFHVDIDFRIDDSTRLIQLTPPGSGCSIVIGENVPMPGGAPSPKPGSYQGLQLVVADIQAARDELAGRGLEVTGPVEVAPGDGGTFLYFADPDGNGWAVQEFRRRAAEPLHEVLRSLTTTTD
ncbi:VOC family protein [Streptomyces sp. PR69]|uniref:VOC family protein n=1 Tax=Streptomyces sp. PR69 TaxID=2984950 RepID=UPI002264179B|nr:VOC family protein [Streptomyces sp. PR69]